jgi:hypothetical protein
MGYRSLDPITTQRSLRVDSTPNLGSRSTARMVDEWNKVLDLANSGGVFEAPMIAALRPRDGSPHRRRLYTGANRSNGSSYLGKGRNAKTTGRKEQSGRPNLNSDSSIELDELFTNGNNFASWLKRAA